MFFVFLILPCLSSSFVVHLSLFSISLITVTHFPCSLFSLLFLGFSIIFAYFYFVPLSHIDMCFPLLNVFIPFFATRGSLLVKAVYYKPEGLGFDPIKTVPNPSSRTMAWNLLIIWQKWVPGIFLRVKHGRRVRLTTSPPPLSRLSRQCGILDFSEPCGPPLTLFIPSYHTNDAYVEPKLPSSSVFGQYSCCRSVFLLLPRRIVTQNTCLVMLEFEHDNEGKFLLLESVKVETLFLNVWSLN
jgi:hypothetical protein